MRVACVTLFFMVYALSLSPPHAHRNPLNNLQSPQKTFASSGVLNLTRTGFVEFVSSSQQLIFFCLVCVGIENQSNF